ncbi:MAG: 2-succinyl-5-enolpyruvyl-6-hydroxy-3-cyclohexene-1-carboxylic-acid synthase [Acidimicrobiia bacterium]|nr:2-succinyl-5-enolpyruvyl-6-hydroxy-3-cyclohexene-1-carboxylic-acid synthase [Acidimicrobiia bacterium]
MTVTATCCATVVDEWTRAGLTDAFIAPGSRSTPMVLALADNAAVRLHVFHDERAASFAALGHGRATGRPAVVLCTSGTAAAHFHAAVIEADLSAVPLIVCTADRPVERWDIGAAQTIDQTHLYGRSVRWFVEPGIPDAATASTWRSMGSRIIVEASGWSGRAGPVHCNLSFGEPLLGIADELPPGRPVGAPWHAVQSTVAAPDVGALAARVSGRAGIIIAGRGDSDPEHVLALGEQLGWPVLADHRSGCRVPGRAIAHADPLLRSRSFADSQRPEVVLSFGEPHASKVVSQWLAAGRAEVIAAVPSGRWIDPERLATTVVGEAGFAGAMLDAVGPRARADVLDTWREADLAASRAIGSVIAAEPAPTEPGVAIAAVAAVPTDGSLVVASSMPVRDVEWFGPHRGDITVHANRGANGIDGVVSTAIGVALTGRPTICLLGDLAFLHDSAALTALGRRPVDLSIVVIDNDGGGIFSFLPQAERLAAERFESLFGTPHGTDISAVGRAHGLASTDFDPDVLAPDGVRLLVARTDRRRNVEVHDRLFAAVSSAIR